MVFKMATQDGKARRIWRIGNDGQTTARDCASHQRVLELVTQPGDQ